MAEPSYAKQLPAPSTFAGSSDNIFSALAFFLGEPAVPEKLKDYSEHHAATCAPAPHPRSHAHTQAHAHPALADHFPDAFEGKSTKLRDTLVNLILDKPDEWQTQVALPFVKIEGTVRSRSRSPRPHLRPIASERGRRRRRVQTVEWDEMHFDVRLLQRVPVRCFALALALALAFQANSAAD